MLVWLFWGNLMFFDSPWLYQYIMLFQCIGCIPEHTSYFIMGSKIYRWCWTTRCRRRSRIIEIWTCGALFYITPRQGTLFWRNEEWCAKVLVFKLEDHLIFLFIDLTLPCLQALWGWQFLEIFCLDLFAGGLPLSVHTYVVLCWPFILYVFTRPIMTLWFVIPFRLLYRCYAWALKRYSHYLYWWAI